jgi:hypothetical protein
MTPLHPLNEDLQDPWELLYGSDKAYRIEILRGLLEEEEIQCVVMNKQDSAYITIGEVEIMVKRSDIFKASQILNKFLERE